MNRSRTLTLGVTLLAAGMLAACGVADGGTTTSSDRSTAAASDPPAAAGMCIEGATECVDTQVGTDEEPVKMDETGVAQLRKDAKFYLGLPEKELNDLIRIARIDDEHMPVTDDYVVGRITVELDTPEGGGKPVVTSATVELPDGPETFELKD